MGATEMPDAARDLYEALYGLERRATAIRKKNRLPSSRREAALAVGRITGRVLDSRRISAWVPANPCRARVPHAGDAEEVLALVAVWSAWAGEETPDPQVWLRLINDAQTSMISAAGQESANQKERRSRSVTNKFTGSAENVIQLHTLRGNLVVGQPRQRGGAPTAGKLITELVDPFALEVHRPIAVSGPVATAIPVLPPYIPRSHDKQLGKVLAQAAAGTSAIATLIGGSSTGKTRACWEAVLDLAAGWRLWHPISPERPEAALEELPQVAPKTVVWLNEAQFYLRTADPTVGERVAAGLRELLREPKRGPVLILGTIWPQYWQQLTALPRGKNVPDPHAQARALLTGSGIVVPETFSGTALSALVTAAQVDPRLAEAAAQAEGGRVTQFLAGVPALLERYDTASPTTKALIHAAMDARNLGCGPAIPGAVLAAAAPGYLTDQEWEEAGDDWLGEALDYAGHPCNGVRGPITRIRPRMAIGLDGIPVVSDSSVEARYRLADYLEQTGRRTRADVVPPATLWEALVAYADPADLIGLGKRAAAKALYRCTVLFYKRAFLAGFVDAAELLITLMRDVNQQHSVEVVHWIVMNTDLEDLEALDRILFVLRFEGSKQAIDMLAERAAAQVDLTTSHTVVRLMPMLCETRCDSAVALLAQRAATLPDLTDPRDGARLLTALHQAKAGDAIVDLARRAVEQADLIDPSAVAVLLDALRQACVGESVAALLARQPASHAELTDARNTAMLLDALREAGFKDAVADLAERVVAHTGNFTDTVAVARLIEALSRAEARKSVAKLARRVLPCIRLTDPLATALLLRALREAHADKSVAALLERQPAAYADLTNPRTAAVLLSALRDADANDAVVRAERRRRSCDASSAGSAGDGSSPAAHPSYGREVDGSVAEPWEWNDLL